MTLLFILLGSCYLYMCLETMCLHESIDNIFQEIHASTTVNVSIYTCPKILKSI